MATVRIFSIILLVGTVQCYRFFQDEIPNADLVPHPCKPNYYWRGVGHKNPLGGGFLNPFGEDFKKFQMWTPELCRMDSDGDGMTNGRELGDPDCKWTKGQFPTRNTEITHPGVCDPWGSAKCQDSNKDVTCDTGEFICEGINSPDVFNITLRFPPTRVPATETSYMCFNFDLDMLSPEFDYHLIASVPFIDNANVMHHLTLTGCDATSKLLAEPELCNMASAGCSQTLAVWTLGMPGDCVYKEAGFKIGPKAGISRLNMQHHWTNPKLTTEYVDSSGLTLYLTRTLRPYDAAYFSTGQTHLVIPPGMDRVVKTSTCSARCTRHVMDGPVKFMTGWNHMHYLGYKQNVEQFRNGVKIRDLTPDDVYSYDNPIVHEYNPPIDFYPGDNLETTCVFRSSSRKTTTMFGEGTFDEMCFGIFTYFPAENIRNHACWEWDDIELCEVDGQNLTLNGCEYRMIFDPTNPTRKELFSKLENNCNYFGVCRTECKSAIAEVRQHPCFRGKMRDYISDALRAVEDTKELIRFLAALHSCDSEDRPDPWRPNAGSLTPTACLFSVMLGLVLSKLL